MTTMIEPNTTTVPVRLDVATCVGCGAMQRLGVCEDGCHEQRLDLVRAAAYDELVAVRQSAHACTAAFRAVLDDFVRRQPAVWQFEPAYRSVQERAARALHRFPDPPLQDAVLRGPTQPAATSWCSQCGGIDAPQQCLELCIWRAVEWVSYSAYQQERLRAVSEWMIETRLRQSVRRIASITPLEGEWAHTWRVLQAEAQETLDAVDPAAPGALAARTAEPHRNGGPEPARANGNGKAAPWPFTLSVTREETEEFEYERGREEGATWAREYAPIAVVCDLVENFESPRSEFRTPHWRGFVTGAEEMLDIIGPRGNGHHASSVA
jgi:ferredoxin